MRRDSFERESAFLGRDFASRIKEIGGKAAGLDILQKALDDWGYWNCGVPEYVVIPTDVYVRVEERLKKGESIEDISQEAFALCRKFFPKAAAQVEKDPHAPYYDYDHFHLRSSSQVEDFVDDRYFGTFQTIPFKPFFTNIGVRPEALWRRFYSMKTEYKEHFQLPDDEALAVILMRSYGSDRRDNLKHATVYSHYPEARELGAVIELNGHDSTFDYTPLQLLFVKDDSVTVHHAVKNDFRRYPIDSFEVFRQRVISSYGEKWVKRRPRIMERLYQEIQGGDITFMSCFQRESFQTYQKYPYMIGKEHLSIPERRIRDLVSFSQRLEDVLGYEVNLEAMVGERDIILVQCRPVPKLVEDRPVQELGPLREGMHLVAESPFVFGSFRHEGKLVYPERKGPYPQHKFSKPVIVWNDNDYCKGIRYWDHDPLALALLNPIEGTALTHGYNLIPPFGKLRDRFHFIGLPGFSERFLSHMKDVRSERLYDDVLGDVRYTPYTLLLESDGRRGRVSVPKEFAQFFLEYKAPNPVRFGTY